MSADLSVQLAKCEQRQDGPDLLSFTMAFQPIVDVAKRRIVAHEALVRGTAGEGAASILSQVDGGNLDGFDQACQVRAIELAARLRMPGRLHVNVQPQAIPDPRGCMRTTLAAVERTGFDAARLTFEIIETEVVTDNGHLGRVVKEYKRHGLRVALSNLATAQSGLARLAEIEPDIVKIGRPLVHDCDRDHKRLSIIASIIRLGEVIGTTTIVEGVERASEAAALQSVGAQLMQGFLFSRPIFEDFCHPAFIFGKAVSSSETPPRFEAGGNS